MTTEEKLRLAIEALEFYADPISYFNIDFIPQSQYDRGDFYNLDFSKTEYGRKPGKLARKTLDTIAPMPKKGIK